MSGFTGTGTADDPVVLPDVNVTASPVTPQNAGPSGNSYVERTLSFTFTLGKGSFGATGQNTVTVSNLRAHVTILKNGAPSMSHAEGRIYGLTPTIMNALTTLGSPRPMERLNRVVISAGDAVNGMAVVYQGTIQDAWQNFDNQPDTFLEIISFVSTFINLQPIPPTSFPGNANVATIMAGLATQAGRNFENNGVQVQLASPYLAGTILAQAQELARQANIEFFDDGTTFAIWPKSGTRGGTIPLVSPASGMINYPKYTSQGIAVRMVFNPNILFGGQIQLATSLTQAQGTWYVNKVAYDLAAQIINGPWFTDIECNRQPGVQNQ